MPSIDPRAADLNAGKLDKRLEAAIPAGLDDAINALAKKLAGRGNPKMFRSKAARLLLTRGVIAMQDDETPEAPAKRATKRAPKS